MNKLHGEQSFGQEVQEPGTLTRDLLYLNPKNMAKENNLTAI